VLVLCCPGTDRSSPLPEICRAGVHVDAGRVTVASALGQVSICAYLLWARTHRQPVIDGRSQSVTHGMGVREQITARNAE